MADQVGQFCNITGAADDVGRLYVENAGGDLDAAINAFYSGTSQPADVAPMEVRAPAPAPAPPQRAQPPAAAAPSARSTSSHSYSSGPRIATFGSMAASESDSNEYYAGGEKSGIAVQGGPKDKPSFGKDSLFEAARNQGAADHAPGAAPVASNPWGRGHVLGESAEEQSHVVGHAPVTQPVGPKLTKIKITFWKGGNFTVEDDETTPVLRNKEDPANQQFLKEMQDGHVPQEMVAKYGRDVHVELVDSHDQDFVPPKPVVKAFTGSGFRLGSAVPHMAESPAVPAQPSATVPTPTTVVDESKPTTKIQIRLLNGTRMVARFNPTQTVGDIRSFVEAAMTTKGSSYVLMTTFPNKVLVDNSQTIDEAKLCNAAIVQKAG